MTHTHTHTDVVSASDSASLLRIEIGIRRSNHSDADARNNSSSVELAYVQWIPRGFCLEQQELAVSRLGLQAVHCLKGACPSGCRDFLVLTTPGALQITSEVCPHV